MSSFRTNLTDYFNGESRLSMFQPRPWHDFFVATMNKAQNRIGGMVTVPNFSGSGNVKSATLYEYLHALGMRYGVTDANDRSNYYKRKVVQEDLVELKSMEIEDPTAKLKIIVGPAVFGFQTIEKPKLAMGLSHIGPVVWVPKNLYGVKIKERNLMAVLDEAPMTPFSYEAA